MHLGWIVCNPSTDTASTRLRGYYPAFSLVEHGITSRVFSRSKDAQPHLDQLDALVFVGLLDADSIALATAARRRGKHIYLDVCHSGSIERPATARTDLQFSRLVALSTITDAIVTPHSGISASLRALFSSSVEFVEIPNQVETSESLERVQRFAADLKTKTSPFALRTLGRIKELLYQQAKRTIGVTSPTGRSTDLKSYSNSSQAAGESDFAVYPGLAAPPIVLWFGDSHDGFGMLSLLRTAKALENVARDYAFELLVVSNNREMFENCVAPNVVRARYLDLKTPEPFASLAKATVCLLPVATDSSSTTLSDDRAALALHHGVPVISSRMSCLEPLASAVVFDDWEYGLRLYLGNEEARRVAVATARPVLEQHAPKAVAEAWINLLRRKRSTRAHVPTVAIFIDLVQDVDVLLPVVDEVRNGGRFKLRVILTDAVARNSPRALRAMMERDITPRYVEHQSLKRGETSSLEGVDWLLTSSESTVPAHLASFTIARLARRLGIRTFTLQHGLENAGLTYFDHAFGPEITFASEYVLTWAAPTTLPANISPATRSKCVAVGRTANVRISAIERHPDWGDKAIVGVFENLHWHRYSEKYRTLFASDIVAFAKRRGDLAILVKSHHTGQFLARERHLLSGAPDNVFVLDPRLACWEPYTAAALLPHCTCAITTPSSVALDAAELGIPVAVTAYDLDIPNYVPLPELRTSEGWMQFVDAALSKSPDVIARAERFLDRVRLPGNASKRTIEFMQSVVAHKEI